MRNKFDFGIPSPRHKDAHSARRQRLGPQVAAAGGGGGRREEEEEARQKSRTFTRGEEKQLSTFSFGEEGILGAGTA